MKKEKPKKKQEPRPRDKEGNIIFPKFDFDHQDNRRMEALYIFQEWEEEYKHHFPIINIQRHKELEEKKTELEQQKIVVHNLFPFPEKPETKDFQEAHIIRAVAYGFFKEVFRFRYEYNGGMQQWDISQIILRKKEFKEIEKLITENSLQRVGDLIFYLIAKIQDTYIDEIVYYESPEMVKQMNNIGKEVEKLIFVIDRTDPDRGDKNYDEKMPDLKQISFVFSNTDPVKIEDPMLHHSIIRAVKKDFGDRQNKNWRKDLSKYVNIYNAGIETRNYKYRIAIALHNFFSQLKLFPIKTGSTSNNQELLCIAKILEHSSIKVGNELTTDEERIKIIRNWINPKRNQLKTYPTHLETKPKIKILEKYFDKKFIACVPLIKSMQKIGDAFHIVERFELKDHINEISHLMSCVEQCRFLIGSQFSIMLSQKEILPHFDILKDLVNGVSSKKGKNKLAELSFKLEGSKKAQTIKDRLPLLLIERAIAEYYENHQEEFNFDIISTEITHSPDFNSWRVNSLSHYQQQQERFLPQFCKNLYQFLLEQAPPTEREYDATKKYTQIIAVFLIRCQLFNQPFVDEDIIQQKVLQWLKDSKEQP